jgi:hypothetical protein
VSQIEYLIALISIIVGLGLADLARSLRELVRPDRAVRWHWLPLTWAAIVFLIILQLWWASFETLQEDLFGRVLVFLPYLLMFLILYLACSFALPDADWVASPDTEGEALNLEAFYFSPAHRRWFFGAMVGLIVVSQITSIIFFALSDGETGTAGEMALTIGSNLLVGSLFASLIVVRRWWVHVVVTGAALAAVLYSLAFQIPSLG